MDNLILKDPNYLRDLEAILASVFNQANLAKQPKYLVEIGCKDGFPLRGAYNFIKSQTTRGKRLGEYTLEVIALVYDESHNDILEKDFLGIPHHVVVIKDNKAVNILKALSILKIDDPMLTLYFEFFSDKNIIDFHDYKNLNTKIGMIQLQAFSLETSVMEQYHAEIEKLEPKTCLSQVAKSFLLDAAKAGWFAKMGTSYSYPKSKNYTRSALNFFVQQPYTIREARLDDLPALIHLEEICLPPHLRFHQELLIKLITEYPEGQLILERHEGIQGFAISQRLKNTELLNDVKEDSIIPSHDHKGPIIHLISLHIMPEKQDLEEPFLEFFLQRALIANNVTDIVSVLRCLNYPGSDVISMESYVKELQEEEGNADQATKLYVKHGAKIIKPIAAYRPNDNKNLGYGVLVNFSRENRMITLSSPPSEAFVSFEEEHNTESIGITVDRLVKILMSQRNLGDLSIFNRSSNFAELGLTSLQILELRSLLTKEFSIELPQNFFIIHETPNQVINFFVDVKLKPYRDWLYETKWKSSPKPGFKLLEPGRTWIIVTDPKHEIGSPIMEYLHEHQQNCIMVSAGEEFKKTNDEYFSIRPTFSEDYKQLFSMIPNLENVVGMIYLWGVEESYNELEEPSLAELEGFHRFSLEGLILLVNSMAVLQLQTPPRLYVVTQTIEQDGRVASLGEWPLSACCKIIRQEYQKFQCRYIAIDSFESVTEACETLFEEITSGSNDPHVAFRHGERLVPRMVRCDIETVRIPKFSSNATYLIAGGFRPLGILLAKWYFSHGARHLVLLDEIEILPETSIVIEELKKLGADIQTIKINLADEELLKNVFEVIHHELPPLRGIIHAAGVVDNDLIMHMNWDRLMSVHRLKVSLSWNLHRFSLPFDLEHFVLFSSCLPDLVPLGKVNHATGNSFLDALAHYRNKRALPALSINWGPWELGRMQVMRITESKLSDWVGRLKLEEGLSALNHFFNITKPQITAVVVNWPTLIHSIGDENPLFDEIAIELGFKRVNILNQYFEAKSEDRLEIVQSYLSEKIRKILKLRSSHVIEPHRDFKTIGLQSTNINDLKNHIQFDLHEALKLPFNFVEANPTLEQLTVALSEALEQAMKSKPKLKIEKPVALVGIDNNKIVMEVLNEEHAKVKLAELSDDTLDDLREKLKEQNSENKTKSTVIIIDKKNL